MYNKEQKIFLAIVSVVLMIFSVLFAMLFLHSCLHKNSCLDNEKFLSQRVG